MNKIEQAGSVSKQNPGMTSYTGNSILHRTQKNTPDNEPAIRGIRVTKEDLQIGHRQNVPVIPYEIFEQVMLNRGFVLINEVV